jgi:polysaccharide deacetylase family protein (PEP-CTERM system associated)
MNEKNRHQILTVNVEDYFHVWAIRNSNAVRRKHWERLDPRVETNVHATLDLLREYGARATFFVFGCIADAHPALIERIVADGHEIASRGYLPRSLEGLARSEFVDDLAQAKLALERAGANRIIGYRSPVWISSEHLWMLDALAEAGYLYDSSVNPILRRFAERPEFFGVQELETFGGKLHEYPITTSGAFGYRVAISGGNYIRQLPHGLLSRAVAQRVEQGTEPVVFYFMPWELDVGQPHIAGLDVMQTLRQYRNLDKTRWVLKQYLERYSFRGIADDLGIAHPPLSAAERPSPAIEEVIEPMPESGPRREATLVIPIFNEEQNVRYLYRTITAFRQRLARRYRLFLVLVDDSSTDNTWQLLNEQFGTAPDTTLLRHEHNRGVAAAILTGVRAAPTEVVCSIDCDCSYDPEDLGGMLPLIEQGDLVTASPYHPDGSVMNVPSWRLFLSKSLSRMYSALLGERFYTYTSCCRVYRKDAIGDLELTNEGFLGVAETLIELKRRGGRVIEYPATLESRLFGESKMKVARTIGKHLGMLGKLAGAKLTGEPLVRHPPDAGPPSAARWRRSTPPPGTQFGTEPPPSQRRKVAP